MRQIFVVTALAFALTSMPGCATTPTPAEQKAIDILGCFGGTLTTAAEQFLDAILQDATKGVTPDFQAAVDKLLATGGADAPGDITCAIAQAFGKASNPPTGAALSPDYMKGVKARAKYLSDKIGLKVTTK